MRRTRAAAAVVGAVALSALLGACGVSLQSLPKLGGVTGPTYTVHATFSDVLNLSADAQVRSGPLVVGDVAGMRVSGYVANLRLDIKDSFKIPVGTGAEVRFDNPLGDEYVELELPTTPSGADLPPGATIPESATTAAPTVEDTLGAFATVLNGGGVGDIETIANELDQVFSGNQPQIRSLLSELDVAARDLRGGLGPVDDALAAVGNLARQLNGGSGTITTGLQQLAPAIGVLAQENDQFDQLLAGLGHVAASANTITGQSGARTVAAIQALVPVVQQIIDVSQQVGPTLTDLRALEDQLPRVIHNGYVEVAADLPLVVSSADSAVTGPAVSGAAAAGPAAAGSAGRSGLRRPAPATVTSLMTAVGPLVAGPAPGAR